MIYPSAGVYFHDRLAELLRKWWVCLSQMGSQGFSFDLGSLVAEAVGLDVAYGFAIDCKLSMSCERNVKVQEKLQCDEHFHKQAQHAKEELILSRDVRTELPLKRDAKRELRLSKDGERKREMTLRGAVTWELTLRRDTKRETQKSCQGRCNSEFQREMTPRRAVLTLRWGNGVSVRV